jgi:hypothetical protein
MTLQARTTLREQPGRRFELPVEIAVVFSDLPADATLDQVSRAPQAGAVRRLSRRLGRMHGIR